jgi:arylsulfatase A-like enzyme
MKAFLFASLFSFLALGACNSKTSDLPNIVLFLVDDMGIMDTSVPFLTDDSGQPKTYPLNELYRTPGMERLAATGIRFNQFCAMSVCSPTRISILNGQNAARHGTTNWINPSNDNRGEQGPTSWNWKGLSSADITLPRLLKTKGYRTMHVGKAHFGPIGSEGEEPLNLGFDINIGGASFGAPSSYYGEKGYGHLGGRKKIHAVPHLEAYHGSDTFLTEALTLETKRLLDDAVKDQTPFFLHFAHYAVHAPFDSDPRFAANYEAAAIPDPAKAFATLIEGMDKSLNDLLDHLEKLGIADNTLILFLGDNGTDAPLGHEHAVACAAPLRGKKGSHYEGGMRVPFIASWARRNESHPWQQKLSIPAGKIQPQLAAVHDLMPTLLTLVGVEAPAEHPIDGRPLQPLLSGGSDPTYQESFLMHYPHGPHRTEYFTSLRSGQWKVIYHYFPGEDSDGQRYQLFNLKTDPFEQNNLATSRPDQLQQMMTELITAMETHQARYPQDSTGTPLKPAPPAP